MILGLAMFYTWIHSVVIIVQKVKKTTPYEKFVMIVGASAFVLFLIGSLG